MKKVLLFSIAILSIGIIFFVSGSREAIALAPTSTPTPSLSVTPATGGESISSNTVGEGYTNLAGPIITEGDDGQIASGSIILNVPSGFEFSASSVTATITDIGNCSSGAGNRKLKLGTTSSNAASSQTVVATTSSITINVYQSSGNNCSGAITFSSIKVRPTAVASTSGNITKSGSSSISGVSSETNFGTLTEVMPPTGAISGKKYEDGTQTGLSGWTITLSGAARATAETAGDGTYSFTELADGEYTVCETLKEGWAQTSPTEGVECDGGTIGYSVAIEDGAEVTGKDFGNFKLGKISGYKFSDLDDNGEWDEDFEIPENSEPGLSGWTIKLDAGTENEKTATTDENGKYEFTGVSRGAHVISEELQNGWKQTMPESGSYTVTITDSGNEFTDNNFGNVQYAQITIEKSDDPESGTFEFNLMDENGNVSQNASINVDDDEEEVNFNNILPGSYKLAEVNPEGWSGTTTASCTVGDNDSFDPTTGLFTINAGDIFTCSFNNTEFGLISGRKFMDANFDGQEGDAEESLDGWTVILYTGGNDELIEKERTTTENGTYTFKNLEPGEYYICEDFTGQTDWVQSYPSDQFTCSNGTQGYEITLPAGQKIENGYDFGNYKKTIITGYKWWDFNKDGEWDKGEPSVGGQEIELDKVQENGIVTELVQLSLFSTDADGKFSFTVNETGTYRVKESSRDQWQQTYPADSFFDIFVDASNKDISTDKNDHAIQFGNIFYQNIMGAKFAPASSDVNNTPSMLTLGTASLSFETEDGTHMAIIPDGTVISRVDESPMDPAQFSGGIPKGGSVTGLSGTLDGALQLGIPDIGLKFSKAITIKIFVGTALNGKTLTIARSISGTGDWTSDGIVEPGTCVVALGYCEFQATKASTYATTHTEATPTPIPTPTPTPSSGGGGGGGGGIGVILNPTPSPTPTSTPTPSSTQTPSVATTPSTTTATPTPSRASAVPRTVALAGAGSPTPSVSVSESPSPSGSPNEFVVPPATNRSLVATIGSLFSFGEGFWSWLLWLLVILIIWRTYRWWKERSKTN